MKFKAVWRPEAAQVFGPAIAGVLRDSVSEKSTVKLSPSKFLFTSLTRRRDHSEAWVVMDAQKACSVVVCESVRGNEIDLSLQTAQLLLALKYVGSSAFCAIRLTKRGSEPVLRFEFNFVDSMSCLVVHDIPVEILRTELVWTEPALPSAESKTILAHPVRRIASHLDHLKGMGISEVLVRVEAEPDFAKVKFSGICDAVTVAIVVPKQPVFSPHESDAQVSLSLTGLLFILTRVANVNDACKCLLLVSEAKYMSVWLQLPNELGAIAAVTPAILVG